MIVATQMFCLIKFLKLQKPRKNEQKYTGQKLSVCYRIRW